MLRNSTGDEEYRSDTLINSVIFALIKGLLEALKGNYMVTGLVVTCWANELTGANDMSSN